MQIGIIQGRLLPPVNGKIQEFPKENWQIEFNLLKVLGLSHIEWIITKDSFEHCMTLDVRKYADRISSVCCDNILSVHPTKHRYRDFLARTLRPICNWAVNNNIKSVTVPFLENISLSTEVGIILFQWMSDYLEVYPEILFKIECDDGFREVMGLTSGFDNIEFVYDSGNIAAKNMNHLIQKQILSDMFYCTKTIHLKDRMFYDERTVEPGKGNAGFKTIFQTLKKNSYNGIFTIQTARGETGKEISTILAHKKYFEDIYSNC